jgi:membrane-associated phospholipid phosphatase
MELNLAFVSRRRFVDPPFASRSYALVTAAMYDAVVASSFWKRRYDRAPPRIAGASSPTRAAPSYPSEHAAIAGAASRVLAYLFRGGRPRALDRVAERAAWSRVWAGTNYPSDVRAGLALGRSIAARVIARAESDGVMRIWSARRPQRAGVWEPPPGSSTQPVEPLAGTWRTWALRSGSQFRAPPPPAYGSPKFLAEARELIELRRHLTPAQKRTAKFWEGGVGTPLPPGVWNEVALAYVRRDRLDTPHAARVLALLNIAMADAGVAIWETKYHYWSPRPENAIRSLGLDRRWAPFLATPPFPAYVSAHSAYSAAASEVLSRLFPRDVARFQTKAREAGLSRLYGGIHFRSDHVAGVDLGRNVARLVLRRAGLTEGSPRRDLTGLHADSTLCASMPRTLVSRVANATAVGVSTRAGIELLLILPR